MRAHRGVPYASEEEPKTCCGMSASQAVSIRWFIIVIAVIGICCTLAGTALGAARSAGKEHLTLSLLMIGVGVLLLTVSAVAWRLTANESGTSCRAMLGFARAGSSRGDGGSEPNRRFVPRLPPTYGRPHHPYAAMMYPEFQYRPPPPSYQASMQEYRLRLLLLERSNPTIAALGSSLGHGPVTMVPPPPYRPYSANMRMLPHARVDEYSRPPSYRSRSSGNHNGDYDAAGSRPSLDPSVGHNHSHHHIIESPMHSRDPSLLSYLSQQSVDNMSVVSGHVANLQSVGNPATTTATVVTVVQAVSVGMDIGLGSTLYDEDGKGLPSLEDDKGYDPERDNKDGNLVRIVQTTDSSQVIGRDSVIVTVSGGGSNTSLWDTYHHHHLSHQTATAAGYVAQVHTSSSGTPNNNNIVSCNNGGTGSNSNVITMSDRSSSVGDQGEVQILAHL
ncbi:hypothetical protein Ocin01_16200 [Orchesella cincta]|uniref:Uncharacterized protein n=1 Tax=Orchesella cincta TaxID=48709 RepID=A0A1D2MBY6_ORCCI|nr:hypothetical protein Ocin01_16200 [Orchesella cincta]